MELVVRLVGVAHVNKGRRRIEARVINVSRYGRSHDDMERVYDRLRQEIPLRGCGLRVTENAITFTARLIDLEPGVVRRFRKVIDTALDTQLV